jgi:hypothetical protein
MSATEIKVELRGRPRKGETADQARARKIRAAKKLAKQT